MTDDVSVAGWVVEVLGEGIGARMIERREPITITSWENGVEITRVIWHPDDPVMSLEPPQGYVEPVGRLTSWWRAVVRSIITSR